MPNFRDRRAFRPFLDFYGQFGQDWFVPRKPSLEVKQTEDGWKVEVPASLSVNGKRERVFFPTRSKAKEYAADLRTKLADHGRQLPALSPAIVEETAKALEILKPFGISLIEAARTAAEIAEAKTSSVSIEFALESFMRGKENKSESQQRAYRHLREALERDFAGRVLSTINAGELLGHVEGNTGTPSSFNRRSETLRAFWRWSAKPPRNWCDAKVVDVLERQETRRSATEVLSAEQCLTLLQTVETHYPDCAPAFAISLFTGIRRAELERLDPSEVTHEGITVPAGSAKTGRRRFIEMPVPLAAWLQAYPISDTVLPANWTRKEKAVRRLAGWKVWCDLVAPPEPPDDLPDWPDNALRHTHASVMVAMGKPLENLTFEFGHSGGAAVLKSHYVGVMSKAEAAKIWSIGPKGLKVRFAPDS